MDAKTDVLASISTFLSVVFDVSDANDVLDANDVSASFSDSLGVVLAATELDSTTTMIRTALRASRMAASSLDVPLDQTDDVWIRGIRFVFLKSDADLTDLNAVTLL